MNVLPERRRDLGSVSDAHEESARDEGNADRDVKNEVPDVSRPFGHPPRCNRYQVATSEQHEHSRHPLGLVTAQDDRDGDECKEQKQASRLDAQETKTCTDCDPDEPDGRLRHPSMVERYGLQNSRGSVAGSRNRVADDASMR